MKAKSFYAVSLSNNMIEMLNTFCSSFEDGEQNGLTKVSYDYLDFPLNELARRAKVDNDFLNEILLRYSSLIYGAAGRYVKNHRYEDYNEVVIYLFNVLRKSVSIFDETRGSFEHLSKKMLRLSLMHYASRKSQIIDNEIKNFGIKVVDVTTKQLLMDSMSSEENISDDIILKLDIEEYKKYLNEQEKEIFELYQYGFTYREIGDKLKLSHSYVGFKIADILDNLNCWREKKLI